MPSDTDANANPLARPESEEQAAEKGQAQASREPGQTTRTSAFSGRSCRQCGQPITGRRRNEFCSDRCRIQASRATHDSDIEQVLAALDRAVSDLRRTLPRPLGQPLQ